MTTYSHINSSTGATWTITVMLDEDWGTPEPHVVLATVHDANGRLVSGHTKRMTYADPAQAILFARDVNEMLTARFTKRKGVAQYLSDLALQFLAVAFAVGLVVSFLFTIGG